MMIILIERLHIQKGETGARIHRVMSDLVWLETLTWTEETGEKKDVLPAVADPDQISV